MSNWRYDQRLMDAEVDFEFAEPIELHPMISEEETTGSPEPDPSRSVLICYRHLCDAGLTGDG